MKLLPSITHHGLWSDDVYAEMAFLLIGLFLFVAVTVAMYAYAAFLA